MGVTTYQVFWGVLIFSGFVASYCFWLLVRIRGLPGLFIAGLVFLLVVLPYQFDDDHYAPALIILFFRVFLERGVELGDVGMFVGLSLVGYFLFGLLVFLYSSLRKARSISPRRLR